VSKDEESQYIKPQRVPKKHCGIRNKKKKEAFEGDGLKPKHAPYHRCPANLHNLLLEDEDV
jgi:hypothetical protein